MFIVLLSSVGILNFFRLHKSPLGLAVSHVHQFSNLDTVFNQSIASPGRERTCQSFGLVYLPVPPPLCQIDSHGHHEAEGRWGSRYDSRGRALREDVRTGRFALPQAWAQWAMKWSVFENKFSDKLQEIVYKKSACSSNQFSLNNQIKYRGNRERSASSTSAG